MSVSFRSPFPILYSEDLPAALRFYRDLLGFSVTFRFPDEGEPVFVGLELDGRELAIGDVSDPDAAAIHGKPLRPVSGHRFELCIYTGDVDAALAELREAGVTVLTEPVDQPWGERLAYVEDPDGNPVMVCAPIEGSAPAPDAGTATSARPPSS
jgi:lactoylglutathione lyase